MLFGSVIGFPAGPDNLLLLVSGDAAEMKWRPGDRLRQIIVCVLMFWWLNGYYSRKSKALGGGSLECISSESNILAHLNTHFNSHQIHQCILLKTGSSVNPFQPAFWF